MNFDTILRYCLRMPDAWQDEPWDGDIVAKVDAKIFAFLGEGAVGVKCGNNRDEADEWLIRFPADASVMAYVGRSGWNTLRMNGEIPDEEILEAIHESYHRVVEKLPKKGRPDAWDTNPSSR